MADNTSSKADNTGSALVAGMVAIAVGGIFALIGYLPAWIFFSMLIIGAYSYGRSYFASGEVGALSAGTFTYYGWLPSYLFFSMIVIIAFLLASSWVAKQMNIGGVDEK